MMTAVLSKPTCNSCGVDLDDTNWSLSWQKVGRHQCKGCSKNYNDSSNMNRMYINGKYIPQTHPLYKPGRYKSLDDAWSHNKIESTKEGEVYAIANTAWPEWVKIGKAVDAEDRLNGYQTSSPFRDYYILHRITVENRHTAERDMHKLAQEVSEERSSEWFKLSKKEVKELFDGFTERSRTVVEGEVQRHGTK